MFNERDRRCAAVQLILYRSKLMTTGPLPAPSKCKSGRFKVAWVIKTKFPATVMVFVCGFKWGPHHATSHLRSWLESQHQSVPGCAEKRGDPQVQSRGPVAEPGYGSLTRRRPTSPKRPRLGFRRSATTLYPSLTGPPPSPTWTRWTTSFGHRSRTSPTWPPTTPKPAWSPSIRRAPARRLWEKACSQFRIHIEAVIEAEGGYIE